MKNYVLHFIRHGATEHQQKGVYMGRRTGSELYAEGIGELLALRREYDYPPVEVVLQNAGAAEGRPGVLPVAGEFPHAEAPGGGKRGGIPDKSTGGGGRYAGLHGTK